MTEVVAQKTVLQDSAFLTRPAFTTYLKPDSNAGGTNLAQIRQAQLRRHMAFPRLVGRTDADRFSEVHNPHPQNPAFVKYNPEGCYKAVDPGRLNEPTYMDPVSGFLSVGGDIQRNTGHTRIKLYTGIRDEPQVSPFPRERNSIRKNLKAAPYDTRRESENDPGSPSPWNGRKFIEPAVKAELGGWTSDRDPRKVAEERLKSGGGTAKADESRSIRDKLANKYLYTSSTQSSYEHVPWDNMLPPKLWPPVKTFEKGPELVSSRGVIRRFEPKAEEWQAVGKSWDKFQTRTRQWKNGPFDISFCSSKPRAGHISGYSGEIGAENLVEMDNPKEEFHPFTMKRSIVPRPVDSPYHYNVPGYTGVTWYRSISAPPTITQKLSHPTNVRGISANLHTTHRPYPTDEEAPERRRPATLTRMISDTAPFNAFNTSKHQIQGV